MNDEFLTQRLPDVRPAFEKALQGKLHRIEHRQRRRTYAVASALVVGLLFSLLLTLPPVRAQMRWLLREIGGVKFVETENPREDWETIITSYTEDGALPEQTDVSIPDVGLSEVLAQYPELARFLPTWIPEGFVYDERIPIVPDSYFFLSWRPEGVTANDAPYPWFGLRIGRPFELPFVVKPDLVQEIFIGDIPAALWEFDELENPQDPEGRIYCLEWTRNGVQYGVSWREPGLTHEDIYRFAESVPDVAELLKELEFLLDVTP